MSQAHVHSPVVETGYLRREETATSRHELVGGGIYAMAGASLARLRYYLLVDSERLWAKAFFRDEHDAWFEQELSDDDRIDVACDGTRLTLTPDDLYEHTGLPVV